MSDKILSKATKAFIYAALTLIILKWLKWITWSWWAVLIPVWIGASAVIAYAIFLIIRLNDTRG